MNIEKTISDLTECYRLIGTTQAKKGFGIFTQEDSRFLSAMYEAGLRHEKAIRAENEKLTKQVRSYAALVKSMEETKSILLRNTHNLAESVATLESEREANKMLTEELNEQARLLGISAEKELALLAKVERLERELAEMKQDAQAFFWNYQSRTQRRKAILEAMKGK